jgi:hypothetical protein
MDTAQLETSLRAIQYGKDDDVDADEEVVRQLLESVVYRRLGQLDKTKELLNKVLQANLPKVPLSDEWMGKCAPDTS